MGIFSFIDCVTGEGIKIGQECCTLIPNEYQYIMSRVGMLYEPVYEGYGVIGEDVYETLALTNRKYLSADFLPDNEALKDFLAGEDANEMDDKYGEDWLRELGIELYFTYGNAKLRYPLKVTTICYGEVSYEDVNAISDSDPNQGCY